MPDLRRIRGALFAALGGMLGVVVAMRLGGNSDMLYPGLAVLAGLGAGCGVWLGNRLP